MLSINEELGDPEVQDYDETVDENAFLADVLKEKSGVRQFLNRSEKIFARSLKLDMCAGSVWLNYDHDIDGCVVELSDLCGVDLPVRHLTIDPNGYSKLKETHSVLKKHINLVCYSSNALENFKNSVGIQLFYESGWECWLGLIPDETVYSIRLSRDLIRCQASTAFDQVRSLLRLKLLEYVRNGSALQTLMKNDMNDLKKIFILPQDRVLVIAALQSCIGNMKMNYFRPIVFCFRFGEKMAEGVSLKMFKPEAVTKVTVHAAATVSSSVSGIHVLWSMEGIQKVIGSRGTLCTCLSLSDCGNFQSNLDGRAMDVCRDLLQLCVKPENVQFVQLYADVPHLKPRTRFHPVSGIIVGGLCYPSKTSSAFARDADRYVSSIDHNFSLLRNSACRIEFVVVLTEISEPVVAKNLIVWDNLDALLEKRPMLVPIPSVTLDSIREIGLWLCAELRELLSTFAKTGNVTATWRALQCELACEKLLWGRPLSTMCFRMSVNLGPGQLIKSRSNTDQLGFLALNTPTSCMQYENTIPYVKIWTKSDAIAKSIIRAAGLHDYIDASYAVLGRIVVLALLKDLYEFGKIAASVRFEQFLVALKRNDRGLVNSGSITLESLVNLLLSKRRVAVHAVFGKLCQLIKNHNLSLKDILLAGITEVDLHHFPAVQTYDAHRNPVLSWDFRMNYWKVLGLSELEINENVESAEVLTHLAKGLLEQRGVIYPSRLKKLPMVWPWIMPCLRKLVQEKLSRTQTVTTLTFLSAIAFMMQGWFVEFDHFTTLFTDLPIKQFRLKTLEILSKFELPKFQYKNLKIYRLHHSIPHQLSHHNDADKQRLERLEEERVEHEQVEDDNIGNRITDEDNMVQSVERRTLTCHSVGSAPRAWSAEEMEMLEKLSQSRGCRTVKELYLTFRSQCMAKNIPFRTFMAFNVKLKRLN